MEDPHIISRLYACIERGAVADVRALFAPEVAFREFPNRVKPQGAFADLDGMQENLRAGAQLLSKQTFAVRSMLQQGPEVAVRLTWTGTMARDAGAYRAGETLTAHVAQFFRLQDGKIAAMETYDCFEV